MKKILLGLMAISVMSLAAAPTLTNDPTADTNVFQTGQVGKIAVKGNLSSDVPQIKYAVYASVDGTYDGTTGEVWKLPTFTIGAYTSTPSSTSNYGFAGQPIPKVYVKRVNGTSDGVMDLTTETVSYKLQLDSSWNGIITGTGAEMVDDYTTSTSSKFLSAFSFMSKPELEKAMEIAGTTSRTITTYDSNYKAQIFLFGGTTNGYCGGVCITIALKTGGIIEIAQTAVSYSVSSTNKADADKIDKYFATTRPISSEVALLVKVQ